MNFFRNLFKSTPQKVSPAFDDVSWIKIEHYFSYYNSTQNWPWVLIHDGGALPEVAVFRIKGHAFLASPEGWYNISLQPAAIQNPIAFVGLPEITQDELYDIVGTEIQNEATLVSSKS